MSTNACTAMTSPIIALRCISNQRKIGVLKLHDSKSERNRNARVRLPQKLPLSPLQHKVLCFVVESQYPDLSKLSHRLGRLKPWNDH